MVEQGVDFAIDDFGPADEIEADEEAEHDNALTADIDVAVVVDVADDEVAPPLEAIVEELPADKALCQEQEQSQLEEAMANGEIVAPPAVEQTLAPRANCTALEESLISLFAKIPKCDSLQQVVDLAVPTLQACRDDDFAFRRQRQAALSTGRTQSAYHKWNQLLAKQRELLQSRRSPHAGRLYRWFEASKVALVKAAGVKEAPSSPVFVPEELGPIGRLPWATENEGLEGSQLRIQLLLARVACRTTPVVVLSVWASTWARRADTKGGKPRQAKQLATTCTSTTQIGKLRVVHLETQVKDLSP